MSKITNDGLTPSGTGCFIAVPIWQHSRHERVNFNVLELRFVGDKVSEACISGAKFKKMCTVPLPVASQEWISLQTRLYQTPCCRTRHRKKVKARLVLHGHWASLLRTTGCPEVSSSFSSSSCVASTTRGA